MIHEILPVGLLQCNCSVIGDEATREAMVIDPADDIEDVAAMIRKHNLKVKQIDYALLKMLDMQATWVGMPAPGDVKIDAELVHGESMSAGSLSANVLH